MQIERREQVRAPAASRPARQALLPLRFQLVGGPAVGRAQHGAPIRLVVQRGDEIPEDAGTVAVDQKRDHAVGVGGSTGGGMSGAAGRLDPTMTEIAPGTSVLHKGRVPARRAATGRSK